ncbi:MAG: hypothetical protein CENE_01610 [Candidatus Celerinatantimonas neptuna]|nr:MAG: hypothetical protein CENE_01610 [Candidatus Celerinatantimonas neptuna]
MDQNTNQLIDNLFARLKDVEKKGGSRDRNAESLIEKHVVAQPSAPYYMAQTMIMQEATIKQLHARLEALEKQMQQNQSHQGGFLSGLFGHRNTAPRQTPPNTAGWNSRNAQGNYNQPQYAPNTGFGRGNSFLGGALQTAAGVAGGVVLGDLMMDMFSHHHPEDVVNIINDNPTPDMNDATDQGGFDNQNQFADASDNWNDPGSFDSGNGADNFADSGNFSDNGFDGDFAPGGFDSPYEDGFDDGFGGDDMGGFDGFDDFNS